MGPAPLLSCRSPVPRHSRALGLSHGPPWQSAESIPNTRGQALAVRGKSGGKVHVINRTAAKFSPGVPKPGSSSCIFRAASAHVQRVSPAARGCSRRRQNRGSRSWLTPTPGQDPSSDFSAHVWLCARSMLWEGHVACSSSVCVWMSRGAWLCFGGGVVPPPGCSVHVGDPSRVGICACAHPVRCVCA